MNETVLSAIFTWSVTIGSVFAAFFVAHYRRRVLWPVSLAFVIAVALLGLASAVSTTVFIITGESTVGTPVQTFAVILRAISSAILLGLLIYYITPPRWQEWIERKAGLVK